MKTVRARRGTHIAGSIPAVPSIGAIAAETIARKALIVTRIEEPDIASAATRGACEPQDRDRHHDGVVGDRKEQVLAHQLPAPGALPCHTDRAKRRGRERGDVVEAVADNQHVAALRLQAGDADR